MNKMQLYKLVISLIELRRKTFSEIPSPETNGARVFEKMLELQILIKNEIRGEEDKEKNYNLFEEKL